MENDTQSRKWLLTFNNPADHGVSHESIKVQISKIKPIQYWSMGDEKGDEKDVYHIHLFLYARNGVRFSTIKKKFPSSHIDYCVGTALENRAYCFKDGAKFNKDADGHYSYVDAKKVLHEGLHFDNTNEESGECPVERPGTRNDIEDLYCMIKDGMSTYEILDSNPQYIMQIDKIDKVRQTVREEQFKNTWRNLDVQYIWGITGSGKTRHVMELYGYENVYRVTDYDHPFDAYKGQDVIAFEEFRSSLRLDDMLKYLDGYPVEFPARYNNKVACFTKVYIITNIDIREQYPNVQKHEPMSWKAFLRRIHTVKVFTGSEVVEMPTEKYIEEEFRYTFGTPFDKEVGA